MSLRGPIVTQPGSGPLVDHIHRLAATAASSALTDGDCLGRFVASGDQAAFETLVGRHGPAVLRVSRAVLRDPTAAEDAFQATFLILARQAGALRRQQSLGSWLHRVAFRVALRARRQDQARAGREETARGRAPANPLDEVSGREVQAIVYDEIAKLSERYRAPLLLCCLDGLSHDEVAKQLGCGSGTLRSRLERGRKLLRKRLGRRGLRLSAALLATELTRAAVKAAVPAALAAATLKMGLAVRGKGAIAGLVSARVATLHDQAARAAFHEKLLRAVALLLLGVVLVGGGALLLRSQAPEGRTADSVESGVDLPQVAAADRPGRLPVGGSAFPVTAQFTPDAKTFVYSGLDGIKLWEVITRNQGSRLPTDKLRRVIPIDVAGGRSDVLLSPDGKVFFTANDAGIREWGLDSAKPVRSLTTNKFSRARLSPDGRLIAAFAAGRPDRLEVLDVADGGVLWSKEFGQMPMSGITFSPDGRSVVVDGWATRGSAPLPDNALHFFDARTGTEGKRIDLGTRAPFKVAFSPDGTRLAAICWGEDPQKPMERRLFVLDAASGKDLLRIEPPENRVIRGQDYFSALAFAPNGRSLVTAGSTTGLIEWDLESKKEPRRFARGTMNAEALIFCPDGKSLVVAGAGSILRLFEYANGAECTPYWTNNPGPGTRGYGQEEPVVTPGPGATVLVWEPTTKRVKARFGLGNPGQWYLLTRGGGKIPVASDDYSSNTDVTHGSLEDKERSRDVPYDLPGGWAVSLDGKTIAAKDYASDTCHLFDAISGTLLKSLKDPGFAGCRTDLTADGRTLFVFGPDRTAQVWDVAAGRRIRRIGPLGDPFPIALLNSGQNTIFDKSTGRLKIIQSVGIAADVRYAAAVSPDGSRIAVGDEAGYVNLFDVTTGQRIWRVFYANGIRTILTFSPDGRNLACTEENGPPVRLMEVASGLLRRTYPLNNAPAWTLAFSPDGKTLVSCRSDGRGAFADLTGCIENGVGRHGPLSKGEMDACWAALLGADAEAAFSSVQRLAAFGGTVDYLRERLRPAQPADDEGIDKFSNGKPLPPGNDLRNERAVEVLEWIGDRPARQLLDDLARGLPEVRLTHDARASLDRLKRLEISAPKDPFGR
jgi:RNA polymerase sigma factor (sigma-70 family)